jgi:hypothetical protein
MCIREGTGTPIIVIITTRGILIPSSASHTHHHDKQHLVVGDAVFDCWKFAPPHPARWLIAFFIPSLFLLSIIDCAEITFVPDF